jgi:hypothetical protein
MVTEYEIQELEKYIAILNVRERTRQNPYSQG